MREESEFNSVFDDERKVGAPQNIIVNGATSVSELGATGKTLPAPPKKRDKLIDPIAAQGMQEEQSFFKRSNQVSNIDSDLFSLCQVSN